MKVVLMIIVIIVSATLFQSCYYNKEELLYRNVGGSGTANCDPVVEVKFSTDVLQVMNASCNLSGCHNTVSAAGNVILDTHSGVQAQASNGRLMGTMNHTAGFSAMPLGAAKLNSCTLLKIQQWVKSGTPNN